MQWQILHFKPRKYNSGGKFQFDPDVSDIVHIFYWLQERDKNHNNPL